MSIDQITKLLRNYRIVDVSQYWENGMPVHPVHNHFYMNKWNAIEYGQICNDHQLILNEHNGTHIDSFRHYVDKEEYEYIDKVPLEEIWGPVVTIDATFLKDRETLEREHVEAWEKEHGGIREGDGVLIDFGWMQYWDLRPNDGRFTSNYPGVGKSAAEYLLSKGVRMVGCDTLGIDAYGAVNDPAHYTFLPNRIPVVENLNNLWELRDKRGYFIALPLKIRDGSASPVSPVVLVEK